ncbi:MAG TPA: hypothetical protein VF263_26055 [Longimicrobiaceae bacterium]
MTDLNTLALTELSDTESGTLNGGELHPFTSAVAHFIGELGQALTYASENNVKYNGWQM